MSSPASPCDICFLPTHRACSLCSQRPMCSNLCQLSIYHQQECRDFAIFSRDDPNAMPSVHLAQQFGYVIAPSMLQALVATIPEASRRTHVPILVYQTDSVSDARADKLYANSWTLLRLVRESIANQRTPDKVLLALPTAFAQLFQVLPSPGCDPAKLFESVAPLVITRRLAAGRFRVAADLVASAGSLALLLVDATGNDAQMFCLCNPPAAPLSDAVWALPSVRFFSNPNRSSI